MARIGSYRRVDDLPRVIPVFPLTGAVVFPRGALPLNIFEPRYLNMIDDAMSGARIIGMIQPRNLAGERPELFATGCAARVTSYAETDDGRYLITLTGVCRFRVDDEIDLQTPYRQVRPDYDPYAIDLGAPLPVDPFDRAGLLHALDAYLRVMGLTADWESIRDAPGEALVNSLCAMCPFDPVEKQGLLEAETLGQRADVLKTLFLVAAAGEDDDPGRLQ